MTHMNTRPLGEFSHYVTGRMAGHIYQALEKKPYESAKDLTDNLNEFSESGKVSKALENDMTGEERNIANLDIKMARSAFYRLSQYRPYEEGDIYNFAPDFGFFSSYNPSLREKFRMRYDHILYQQMALGHLTSLRLDYQDIIVNNPEGDTRSFMPGEIGNTEKQFYRVHKKIHMSLVGAQNAMSDFIYDPEHPVSHLQKAKMLFKGMSGSIDYILDDMPPEHYEVFKRYHQLSADENRSDSISVFSPAFPVTELKLMGSCGKNAKDGDVGVYDILRDHSVSTECYEEAVQLADLILDFRAVHKDIVKKYLPNVFNPPENPKGFFKQIKHDFNLSLHSMLFLKDNDDEYPGIGGGFNAACDLNAGIEQSACFKTKLSRMSHG